MKAKDYKNKAYHALSGNWLVAVLTTFVASLFGIFGTYFSSSRETIEETDIEALQTFFATEIGQIVLVLLGVLFSVWGVVGLIKFVIGGALEIGYRDFTTKLVEGQEARFVDLFGKLDMVRKGFLMQLLRGIFIFLWSLLLIIPGIIKSYSYAMTAYVLKDKPELSAIEALIVSSKLMKGHKWQYFCLQLSFIGWDLLCMLTLGIGYLWLAPYKNVAYAAFYDEIKQ